MNSNVLNAYAVKDDLSFGYPYYFSSFDDAVKFHSEDQENRKYPRNVKIICLDGNYYLLTPIELRDHEEKRAKALAKLNDEDIKILGL